MLAPARAGISPNAFHGHKAPACGLVVIGEVARKHLPY
jgi:hypothetical protein